MRRVLKTTAVVAGLLLATAGLHSTYANCTNFGAGFPVFQCTSTAWFEKVPAAGPSGKPTGTVSAVWWQFNMGNLRVDSGSALNEGTGVGPVGVFHGNDNGLFPVVLTDAATALGNPAIPAGYLCSNVENSWSQPGVDGCADIPRTAADNDDILNKYWSTTADPYYYSLNYQIDYPMALMLRESSGQFFALAAVASQSRGTTADDRARSTAQGTWDFGDINNAHVNVISGLMNQVPWQAVPTPQVSNVTINTSTGERTFNISWPNVTVHSDGSVRPSVRADVVTGGVGVGNMGNIVRFVLERASVPDAAVGPGGVVDANQLTWTAVQEIAAGSQGPVVTPTPATMTVPPNTALRVRTVFGRSRRTTTINVANCRLGQCGDLGIEATDCDGGAPSTPNATPTCAMSSPLTVIGGSGPLISEMAADTVAVRNKNSVSISFRTTSEQTVTSISILGYGAKDAFEIKQVPCKQCTTGTGDSYTLTLVGSELKGAKQIGVRLNGPNTSTQPVPIQ